MNTLKFCKSCTHWQNGKLTIVGVKVVAYCPILSDDTFADDHCPEWKSSDPNYKPPEKPVKQYNSWEAQEYTCEECRKKFKAKPSNKDGLAVPRRFCGDKCYRKWQKKNPVNKGCFKPGNLPFNKGMKGIRHSPETEFKTGNKPKNTVPVGTCILRSQGHGSKRRQAFVKIGEPNVWKTRAQIVWEQHNGELPKGMLLRHLDDDSLNDDIKNLEAVTRAQNLAIIRAKMGPKKRSAAMKKMWSKRHREESTLKSLSVADLKKLGYTHYCPECEKPSKSDKLKCHSKVKAATL